MDLLYDTILNIAIRVALKKRKEKNKGGKTYEQSIASI
jgi:hypothetical protein